MINRKKISKILLVLLGITFLKVLAPQLSGIGDCGEFGHVHLGNPVKQTNTPTLRATNYKPEDQGDDCHEGKSVFTYATLPAQIFNFEQKKYDLVFELIYSIEINFKSPHLEPNRKPPKYS